MSGFWGALAATATPRHLFVHCALFLTCIDQAHKLISGCVVNAADTDSDVGQYDVPAGGNEL